MLFFGVEFSGLPQPFLYCPILTLYSGPRLLNYTPLSLSFVLELAKESVEMVTSIQHLNTALLPFCETPFSSTLLI